MIRKAEISDAVEIASIEKRVFRHPWSKNQIKHELVHGSKRLNLVMSKNEIIGYMMVLNIEEEAQILNFALDVPYQHRGYGKELLGYTLNELGEETVIFLEVRKSNLPAIKLYYEFEFGEIGIRQGYYQDGEDAVIMQRKSRDYGVV